MVCLHTGSDRLLDSKAQGAAPIYSDPMSTCSLDNPCVLDASCADMSVRMQSPLQLHRQQAIPSKCKQGSVHAAGSGSTCEHWR